MMKLKRHSILDPDGAIVGVESWLDWQIRSMSRAGTEMKSHRAHIKDLLRQEREAWATRVSRLGFDYPHIAKYVVAWRSKFWWNTQKWYNSLGWDPVRHKAKIGRISRWEDSFSLDWLIKNVNNGPMGPLI